MKKVVKLYKVEGKGSKFLKIEGKSSQNWENVWKNVWNKKISGNLFFIQSRKIWLELKKLMEELLNLQKCWEKIVRIERIEEEFVIF